MFEPRPEGLFGGSVQQLGYMLAAALVLCILCYSPTVGSVQFYRYCYSTAVLSVVQESGASTTVVQVDGRPGSRAGGVSGIREREISRRRPGFSRRQIEDIKKLPLLTDTTNFANTAPGGPPS